jgi:hypothetical protein
LTQAEALFGGLDPFGAHEAGLDRPNGDACGGEDADSPRRRQSVPCIAQVHEDFKV